MVNSERGWFVWGTPKWVLEMGVVEWNHGGEVFRVASIHVFGYKCPPHTIFCGLIPNPFLFQETPIQ